jgi:hypothetical protein
MSDDRIRAMFRRADAAMSDDAPTLEATMRQAKRERTMRRVAMLAGGAGVVAVLVVVGAVVLRPQVGDLTPVATPSASDPVPTVAPATPCRSAPSAEPADEAAVRTFIATVMDRRVAGTAAEGCLSENAAQNYDAQSLDHYDPDAFGGAGPMCLYACGDFDITEYRLDTPPQQADANSWSVDVVVLLSDGKETVRITETLFVGPGTSSDGTQQPLIVRGATTTGGLP